MHTHARTASGILLALGCADLLGLDLLLLPRLKARAEPCAPPPAPLVVERVVERVVEKPAPESPPPASPALQAATPPQVSALVPAVPDITFDFGVRNYTSARAAGDLRRVAAEMRADPSRRLVVRGHADKLGLPAYNLSISRQRAEVVVSILVGSGAPAERITLEAVGDAEPAETGENPKAWAKNRRVELLWR